MAERKLLVVTERPVTELTPELREQWQALLAKKARIERAQGVYDRAAERFLMKVERALGEALSCEGHKGFHVDPDGNIWQRLCECPSCQADLLGIPVALAVELMLEQGLIDPDDSAEVRKKAAEIDAKKRDAVRKQTILN